MAHPGRGGRKGLPLSDPGKIKRNYIWTLIWYWLPLLAWMGVIFYLSAQPDLPGPPSPWLVDLLANVAHFVLYAVLAFLWWRALTGGRRTETLILGLTFVAAVLYGLSDEYHQSFVPGRDPSLKDLFVDAVGAATVLGLIWWRSFRNTKRRSIRSARKEAERNREN